MEDTLPYYLGFSHFLGIGPIKFNLLKEHYSSLKKAYEAPFSDYQGMFGTNLANKFVDFRRRFDAAKVRQQIEQKGIIIVTREDKHFPQPFLNLADPPICLYVKGDLNSFDFSEDRYLAIVGTRKPTPYGRQVAYKFAYDLSLAGFIVVSGLAIGIDALAHRGALEAKGKTVAFLGCGVDIIYPPVNWSLYEEIIKTGGLVISEFPPGMTVLKGLFVARNRLISGLSRGVMVVEGLKDSGSLITARFAAEQGKEVFAPPSPITSPLAEAPNLLIKEGAKMVTSIDDILEEYHLQITPKNRDDLKEKLTDVENQIFSLLEQEARLPDDLADRLSWPVTKVLTLLSGLELEGIIEKNQQGKYQIKL
ncbi:DNA protecting protein DprA [Candidatus Roizmanbacteria bacterium RIFCSPLOWO2_01_FULL_41_22]|uniref:DNA protecting protein DprA n=1 Tax=Candidatus Roizmanbacteria bacterium RIFCSPLOWO2_01_FULL_41_22 TaxID=1802067 RepID=A0A1F7J7R7_9BACT|nr:MAG: DNA protecting protein DprA [Candidatus Roizmanbacteria bacterium RIFCSPLOWO2_01_FULL_41_22]